MSQPAPTEQFVMGVLKAAGLEPAAADTIRQVRPVASSRLHRVYEVVLSNGRTLELLMPPASMLRLLRSERRIINSEAVVVQWLSAVLSDDERVVVDPGSTRGDGVVEEEDEDSEDGEGEDVDGDDTRNNDGSSTNHGEGPTRRSSGTGNQQDSDRCSPLEDDPGLLHLLPKLIHHSSNSTERDAPYALYQPRDRSSILSLPTLLTIQQRAQVDYQLGTLTRGFSTIISPTGQFGPAGSILASPSTTQRRKDGTISRASTPGKTTEGCRTWSETFHLMLEDILRDAEDMAITVPYPAIRKHFLRLSYVLDEITEPRLVFIDGTEDSNVLVALEEEDESEDEDEDGSEEEDSESDSSDESTDDKNKDGRRKSPPTETIRGGQGAPSPKHAIKKPITITGLRDWSNAIFGDPLIAPVFSNNPSRDFLTGYHSTDTTASYLPTPPHIRTHEDITPAEIRILLYQAYHATVAIVTEFYRPRIDSTTRELAARRRLNEILKRLGEVDDPKGSRHRRPSGEMSPAKKLKPDEREWSSSSRRWDTMSPLRD